MMPLPVVAKLDSRRKVVDTGMRRRVRISRKSGAAICRNWKDEGAVSKPFDARRP
jgi:hypothetical protein